MTEAPDSQAARSPIARSAIRRSQAGRLVLVATPIGNLADISPRAADTLRAADVIACEDTRHTRKLLNHLEIRETSVIAAHEHNEASIAAEIAERVSDGQLVALVTDAGTPAISDPGQRVVRAVADAGLAVSIVPGPSAFVAALAISGLPTDRFTFHGFLARKGGERKQQLLEIATSRCTSVLYEAPHRLAKTASELQEVCGDDRRVVLVRELTKLYEEVWRGNAAALVEYLTGRDVKGECVLVVEAASPLEVSDERIIEMLRYVEASGTSRRDAVTHVSAVLGVARGRVYALAHR